MMSNVKLKFMQKIIIYKQKIEKAKTPTECDIDEIVSDLQEKYKDDTITFIMEKMLINDETVYLPFRVQSKRTVKGF